MKGHARNPRLPLQSLANVPWHGFEIWYHADNCDDEWVRRAPYTWGHHRSASCLHLAYIKKCEIAKAPWVVRKNLTTGIEIRRVFLDQTKGQSSLADGRKDPFCPTVSKYEGFIELKWLVHADKFAVDVSNFLFFTPMVQSYVYPFSSIEYNGIYVHVGVHRIPAFIYTPPFI